MKLLYFTDLHYTTGTTRSRTDVNVKQTLLNLLDQIKDYCLENNIKHILHGGDLFDQPSMDLAEFLEFENFLTTSFIKNSIKLYTIIGNHDLHGNNYDILKFTSLDLLRRHNCVEYLNPYSYLTLDNYNIHGFHYAKPVTENLIKGQVNPIDKGINIAVAHADIAPKHEQFAIGVDEVVLAEGWNHLLLGHVHDGHQPFLNSTGCKISNPGSLFRKTKKDMQRDVQIAIIDGYNIEYVKLNDPGSFKTSVKEGTKKFKFTTQISKVSDNEFLNLEETVDKISNELKSSLEVKKEVKYFLKNNDGLLYPKDSV